MKLRQLLERDPGFPAFVFIVASVLVALFLFMDAESKWDEIEARHAQLEGIECESAAAAHYRKRCP